MTTLSEKILDTAPDLELVSKIVAAYVGRNELSPEELPHVIQVVYSALMSGGAPKSVVEPTRPEPAVAPSRSVKPDYIICLEDGKRLKMLKRHLRTSFNMTPDEYRARWGLARNYPMVAPNYSERRSTLAKEIGLGRKAGKVAAAKPGRPRSRTAS